MEIGSMVNPASFLWGGGSSVWDLERHRAAIGTSMPTLPQSPFSQLMLLPLCCPAPSPLGFSVIPEYHPKSWPGPVGPGSHCFCSVFLSSLYLQLQGLVPVVLSFSPRYPVSSYLQDNSLTCSGLLPSEPSFSILSPLSKDGICLYLCSYLLSISSS